MTQKTCTYCNTTGGEDGLMTEHYQDYDQDPDEMYGYDAIRTVCTNWTYCARQIIEQGHNVAALKMVASDYENLGELATQAKTVLNELRELAREQAHWADLEAAEDGHGFGIGAGGGYG